METFSEYTKKKKKKSTSFREHTESVLGITIDDDIAPVKTTTSGGSMGAKRNEGTIGTNGVTVKTTQKDSYLQKGALSDGLSLKNIRKARKATGADIAEDATKGILGLAERVWDGFVQFSVNDAYMAAESTNIFGDKTLTEANQRIYEEGKKEAAEYVAKDLIKEEEIARKIITEPWEQKTGIDMESASIFGSKSDKLVQSASDMLVRQGLNYVVPGSGLALTGLSSLGGEAENAYKNGATYEQALLSGMISAGAEVGTEKIAGIKFGGKTLTDGVTKSIAKKVPNKVLGTLAKWGFNTVGEGAEEVIAGQLTAVGQHLTYQSDKELDELFSNEDKWESFLAGAILGGVFEGASVVNSNVKGIDYVTEIDKNEQKVIDTVYNDLIKEQETDGKKLTQSEKNKLYASVEKTLEKGYIDIDTIEKTLGGETYKNYKATVDKEDALMKEYEELGNTSNPTLAQTARYNELSQQVKDIKENSKRDKLKKQLSDEVFSIAQNTRLSESYNERLRTEQSFEADLNKYTNESAKQTVKNFMEQTKSNNTNRAHDFVDMLTKVSEDRGQVFEFTTTAQLEESIKNGNSYNIDVDPKNVEAFIHKKSNRIVINMDANKSLRSLVGHEVIHTMENASNYDEVQKAVFKYAELKGEYAERLASVERRYGKDDVNYELTADLLGDYIMSDTEFINSLSTENPGILKRIYNEIKYLYKMATAGSAELRQLEKVKREIEKAWRENAENTADEEVYDDVQYSVAVDDKETLDFLDEQVSKGEYNAETNPDGGYYVTYKSMSFWGYDENGNAILRSPMAEYVDGELSNAYLVPKDKEHLNWYKATETIDEATGMPSGLLVKTRLEGRKSDSYLPAIENQDLIKEDWSNLYFNLKKKIFEKGKWKDSDVPARYNPYEHSSNSMLNDQFTAAYKRDNLVTVKMYVPVSEDNGAYRAKWSKDPTGWTDWKNGIVATKIGKQKDLQRRLYLSRYAAPVEIVSDSEVAQAYKEYLEGTDVAIPDNVVSPNLLNELRKAGVKIEESGKIKYSLSDSEGKQLTKEQQEYFKDSKVRDENGNLKVMYHGTGEGGFHNFNPYFSHGDTGFFFADSNTVAKSYSGTHETYAAKTLHTADDLNNIFAEINAEEYEAREENGQFVLYEDGDEIATSDSAKGLYEEYRDWTGDGYGNANYKVYLNLKNPLVVDAKDNNWNELGEYDEANTTNYEYIHALKHDDGTVTVEWSEESDVGITTKTMSLEDIENQFGNYVRKQIEASNSMTATFDNLLVDKNTHELILNTTKQYSHYAKENGYDGVIFNNIVDNGVYASGMDRFDSSTVAIAFDSNQIKSVDNPKPTTNEDIRYSLRDSDGSEIDSKRISRNEFDVKYSLSFNKEIAQGQSDYVSNNRANAHITLDELSEAQRVTNAMVDVMMKYSSILPEDKIGKVLTSNGSYDKSVENTTICVRTLAYNEFVDKVQEELGRPMTQMESFLVSQKLYDIANDPQCLYCYVSLDRKAFNDMLLRYMNERDTVIAKYNKSDKTQESIDALYEEFRNGRKDTKDMRKRFNDWISYEDNGTQLLSLADIATEKRQNEIKHSGGNLAEQLKEARKYAQSASWSKIQKNYVAYRDEILKLNPRVVNNLNKHYGLRWYSFSDYSPAFIVENMQQITDASIRGLKGLAYTKDTDFAEIYAPSGMNINVSVFVNTDENGNFFIDEKQSAKFEEAKRLRSQFPNVGIVATVTNDEALRWAASQEWSDVIIPFHIVRTGSDVAEYYKWLNYTSESGDKIGNQDLWNAYLDSLNLKTENARKKVSKNIYPSEHKNNKDTYLNLCESRGLTPRFVRFAGEDWYMKLVNETRLSADESVPLKPIYNEEVAKASFEKFVKKGGYEGGWYRSGVDVDAEASIVAQDVLAGKKANEVSYGRQDGFNPESLLAGRKNNRMHGKMRLSDDAQYTSKSNEAFPIYAKDLELAPVTEETQEPLERTKMESEIEPTTQIDYGPLTEAEAITRDDKQIGEHYFLDTPTEEVPITPTEKLNEKQVNLQRELENVKVLREQAGQQKQDKISSLQATYDALKNKDTKKANALKLRIEKQKRIAADIDSTYSKRIDTITKRQERLAKEQQKDHANKDRLARAYAKIDRELKAKTDELGEQFDERRYAIDSELENQAIFIGKKASDIYNEVIHIRKGVRASEELGYLLDMGFSWQDIKQSLLRVSHSPTKTVTKDSSCEMAVREVIDGMYMDRQAELETLDAEYEAELARLEAEAESARDEARVATQRRVKGQEHTDLIKNLIGNTATWVDKKLGVQYKTNTLKRNLRDIVRDENGKPDIAKADAIYEELEGKYDHNEALLKRESSRIKEVFANNKITKAEDKYIQMLGELRHNPNTTLTEDAVKEFYEKNKRSINAEKVDKIIEDARATYDSLLERVNEVLREQGMKEIPYRKGYFPHFTDEKQSFLAKLLNWKTINTEIPTSIAGLTEEFNPNRSWQAFNKQRTTDDTDYSFTKGLDSYVHGALDWIYHIDDIQKRRAFENHIRYTHSPEYVQKEIDRLKAEDKYDADTLQEMVDGLYAEANNPLNNFVTDLRAGTNNLANKKDSMDRGMESFTNRKFYSTMTNLSNRVTANQVAGSVSSALTNFIPITQSWGEVSPVRSLQAMKDTMKASIKDDGIIAKSDFLTNRLMEEEKLYKTGWDKTNEAVTFLMTAVDSFTSQTVWRSKYIDNISKGMSENAAIKNADEFAKSLIAGRSRGNMPTIFNAKNPLIKVLTSFQLEVNNQYGYMFKDMPQAMKDEGTRKLVSGYLKMFAGAYAYNALYSSLTGRDAAFDPIGIIEDLLRDLGLFGEDDEEESLDAMLNLAENITDELPFIGGILGGGRIPISSALPYGEGITEVFTETAKDLANKDYEHLTKEWMNPVYYLAMPIGGGQLRKTVQGLSMFSDEHPVAGSYTDSGALRFPIEDSLANRVQAGLFGQYASENARDYFDNNRSPLKEKQIQEYADLDMPIREYWDYREGLSKQETLEEKFDYIADLDVSVEQKNIMINNVVDRKEKVDMSNYDDFANYEEFDFYSKNTEKYNFLQDNGISYSEYKADKKKKEEYDSIYSWYKNNPEKVTVSKAVTDNVIEYKQYTSDLNDIRADKDANGESISGSAKAKKIDYINGLDLDYGQKIILFRTYYDSKEDKATYNAEIVDYLNSREDLSYEEIITILEELDFTVHADGTVEW